MLSFVSWYFPTWEWNLKMEGKGLEIIRGSQLMKITLKRFYLAPIPQALGRERVINKLTNLSPRYFEWKEILLINIWVIDINQDCSNQIGCI